MTWHGNGQFKSQGRYSAGEMTGEYLEWFDMGALWQHGSFEAGKSHGHWTWLHPNGIVALDAEFRQGERSGTWTYVRDSGVVEKVIVYPNDGGPQAETTYSENGRLVSQGERFPCYSIGNWRWWHPNGQLARMGAFDSSGDRVGTWVEFDEKGNESSRTEYAKDASNDSSNERPEETQASEGGGAA